MRWGVPIITALVACCAAPQERPQPQPDPAQGRAAWATALSTAEPGRVWDMLGPELRARWQNDAEAFERWCALYCADLMVQAVTDADLAVRLHLEGGVSLMQQGEGWRVARGPLVGDPAEPADALQRLRAGVARMLAADALDGDARAAWARLLAGIDRTLRAHDPSAVQVDGDSARVALEGGGVIKLQRTSRGWRVVELPHP